MKLMKNALSDDSVMLMWLNQFFFYFSSRCLCLPCDHVWHRGTLLTDDSIILLVDVWFLVRVTIISVVCSSCIVVSRYVRSVLIFFIASDPFIAVTSCFGKDPWSIAFTSLVVMVVFNEFSLVSMNDRVFVVLLAFGCVWQAVPFDFSLFRLFFFLTRRATWMSLWGAGVLSSKFSCRCIIAVCVSIVSASNVLLFLFVFRLHFRVSSWTSDSVLCSFLNYKSSRVLSPLPDSEINQQSLESSQCSQNKKEEAEILLVWLFCFGRIFADWITTASTHNTAKHTNDF